MTTTTRHFTAWMVNDPSCLDQPCMDVTVIEDKIDSYREVTTLQETEEIPEWVSSGEQMFHAVTTVNAKEGDAEDGISQAVDLLGEAGWRVVGTWEAVANAYLATVERDEERGQ